MVLICGVFQALFLSLAFRLNFPIAIFLCLPAHLIRSQARIWSVSVVHGD